jgi:hypothetical protein
MGSSPCVVTIGYRFGGVLVFGSGSVFLVVVVCYSGDGFGGAAGQWQ